MKQFPEMNWSGFVRKAIEEKAKQLELIERLKQQMESPEEKEFIEWTVELGRRAKKGRWKRFLEELSPEERKRLLK